MATYVGTEGNDSIDAGGGDDVIRGLGGDDSILTGNGFDFADGGDGNDTIDGGGQEYERIDDTMRGGAGDDVLIGGSGTDIHEGGTGADTLRDGPGLDFFRYRAPSEGGDQIFGAQPSDYWGHYPNQFIFDRAGFSQLGATTFALDDPRFYAAGGASAGHDADDRIIYDTASGRLYYDSDGSGASVAVLIATIDGAPAALSARNIVVAQFDSAGNMTVAGSPGADGVLGASGNDTIDGAGGNDTIMGGRGANRLIGGDGDDELWTNATFVEFDFEGRSATDTLDGGLGDDFYWVDGNDVILADAGGVDTVRAIETSWTLHPTLENLRLESEPGRPTGIGNDLDNVIQAAYHGGTLYGMGGNDLLMSGYGGYAIMYGGTGDDTLSGAIEGGELTGDAGHDVLLAGSLGDTLLTGGAGSDQFHIFGTLFTWMRQPVVAEITDFHSATDKIHLSPDSMPQLGAAGHFASDDDRFMAGPGFTSGREASDRVIYDTSTGNLYYDADGSGSAQALIIATLQGAPSLAATDIVVRHRTTGAAGNDLLIGAPGNDSMDGMAGDDTIVGAEGHDRIDGDGGNDRLDGRQGNDTLIGGEGADRFAFTWGPGVTNADDVFYFVSGTDRIVLSSTDHLNIGASGDFAAGDDRFMAGPGFSSGREASDRVVYDTSTGRLYHDADGSGPGAAQLIATFYGRPLLQASDITVEGPTSFDATLVGAESNDTLAGGSGNDRLDGREGNDRLEGGTGADRYAFSVGPGTANADTIVGFVSGTDRIMLSGTDHPNAASVGNFAAGDDRFMAGPGFTSGREGSDRVVYDTSSGNLYYDADGFGPGAAQLIATLQGAPLLRASDITIEGPLRFVGTGGDDTLVGTGGNDTIQGLGGNDRLDGAGGNDLLAGGAGADRFIFANAPGGANSDRISDFSSGADRLLFQNAVFTALGAAGNWSAGDDRFMAGAGFTAAQEGSDRLVYNTSTGDLYYDADGMGGTAAVLVATLQGAPTLSASDITVF